MYELSDEYIWLILIITHIIVNVLSHVFNYFGS